MTVPIKYAFEKARIAWRENGGIVSGCDVEYKNLQKVCKAKRLKIDEVIPLLLSAVQSYFVYCKQRKADNVFCESPSSFTVYINQQRWTREYPVSRTNKPKPNRCVICDNTGVSTMTDGKGWCCRRTECKEEYAKL